MDPLTQNLKIQLSDYESSLPNGRSDEQELQHLLSILARSCQQVVQQNHHSLAILARLINTAYSQSQGHLRKHLTQQYGASFMHFMKLLRQHMPAMTNEQFFGDFTIYWEYWSFQFLAVTLC